jgi:hypothetical protein
MKQRRQERGGTYSVGLSHGGCGRVGGTSVKLVVCFSSGLALGDSSGTVEGYSAIEETTADSRSSRGGGNRRCTVGR